MRDIYDDLTPQNPTQSCGNCPNFRWASIGGRDEPEDVNFYCVIGQEEIEEYETFEQAGFNCLKWEYYDWDEHHMREAELQAQYYQRQ